MKMLSKYLVVLLFFSPEVFRGLLFAQQPRFERFTVESGLQNNIVYVVTQDAKGMMWFGTGTGIDRFDGNRFVHYPLPLRNDVSSSAYAQIQFLAVDGKKNIWAASSTSLYSYNHQKDLIELPGWINDSLGSRTITSLALSPNGEDLFLGTSNGFIIFSASGSRITAPQKFNNYVRCVFQDDQGVLWVGGNRGFYRFIFDGNRVNEIGREVEALKELLHLTVTGISQDKLGRYWIVTTENGLFVYNKGSEKLIKLNLPKSTVRAYAVKDVFHQEGGNPETYVSLDGGGVVVLDSGLVTRKVYLTNEDDPTSLSNNAAYDIFSDHYRRIWITTYGGGVNVMNLTELPFENFTHQINNSNSLGNNSAKAVTEDGFGRLWFGTRRGISRYDPASGRWVHLNEESGKSDFTSDNVLALVSDGGNIWAGTYGGGLLQINPRTNEIKAFQTGSVDSRTLGTDFVYALCVDRNKKVWSGGIRGPISYYDVQTQKFVRLKTPVVSVNCIIENSDGEILVGTEKGVWKVTGDSLENYFGGNVPERVLGIMEYKPGEYWLATLGGGIRVINKINGKKTGYRTGNGLPSDVICALLKDTNGDVWVGTSKGIAHFQPKAGSFTVFTKADGLAGSQVNYGAAFFTRNGEIIFGTTDGFSLFKPENIKARGYKPVIVLTGLLINNKQVLPGEKDSPLKAQVDEVDGLRLNYNQNSFTLEFVNTSPNVSGKHLYSWKLEGFDNDWSKPSTIPAAVYTNLNYGSYKLIIKAYGKGQSDLTAIRELQIKVLAPWWKTGWAYLAYLFLFSAALFAVFNQIQNSATRKKYAERLRLNTSISHEIRTPLTLIKGPVSALLNAEGISEEGRDNLFLARKNIEKLESIISQFIDFQKTGINKIQMQVSKEDIVHLIDDVTSSFIPLMKEKQIQFVYVRPKDKIELLFDREKMEKVFNNLLSNAVKYTLPGKEIGVEVRIEGKHLVVQVRDQGIGIPADQQHFLFKGYFRADNTVNIKEAGSGIGLSVAKELVEMHHGKLSFRSENGKGSEFTVRIPLHDDSLLNYLVKSPPSPVNGVLPEFVEAEPGEGRNRKIVVVEDNDELRGYIEKELSAFGFKVFPATDGKVALEITRKQKPDLVITDIMMPEMNGFQLCSALKRDISTCHIPVIMLTAIHDKHYLLEGYRSGADDFVRKPFDMAYIVTRIDNLLENRVRFRSKIMSVFEQEKSIVDNNGDLSWLKEVTRIIVENIGNPDFSVDKLSRAMALSRPVFFRKFKAITNESPQHFIQQLRLRKAIELFQKGGLNINEVAFECGFSDQRYFSTAFRKHFGNSPSEYIHQVRK